MALTNKKIKYSLIILRSHYKKNMPKIKDKNIK
jgi:hypothetical protein